MKRNSAVCLVLGVLVLSPVASGAQGVYLESVEVKKGEDPAVLAADPARVSKSFLKRGKFRQEQSSGMTTILLLDEKVIYTLDSKAKTYTEMKVDELRAGMEAAGDMMAKQREELRKQLADLPEDQRKIVEQQMGKVLGPAASAPRAEIAVKATGEKRKICGYSCERTIATEGGKEVLVAWATRDIPEMEAMREDWEETMESLSSLSAALGVRIAEAYRKVKGYPLETEAMGVHTVTTKVERKAIEDDLFLVPDGYTKTDSPLAGMGGLTGQGKAAGKKAPSLPKKAAPRIAPAPVPAPAPKAEPAPAPKAAVKFCAGCGAKLLPGARFCTDCGKKIGG